MKVAIIIVSYNGMPWADRCLLPLNDLNEGREVFIIDNGSTDGSQNHIQSNFPKFNFYQSESNMGFGKANNLGFRLALEAGCTHFFLLNQDAHISWENVEKMCAIMNDNPEYGILSPVQLYNDDTVDKNHLKSLLQNSYDYINDLIIGRGLKNVYEIGYTNAALWLLSNECLKKVGGFDPLFPHYGEDSEYAQRANYFNMKSGICPEIYSYHYRSQHYKKREGRKQSFIKYLVKLKNNTISLNAMYFRFFAGSLFSKPGKSSRNDLLGLADLLKLKGTIKKHREENKVKSYYFINE